MKLGIDFGTTRTVVACADRGNFPVVGFVDDDGDAHDWIPSIVAERDGELLFGFAAAAAAADPGAVTVRSFKRLLAEAIPGRAARVGRVELELADLVTRFLGSVREAILTQSTAFGRDGRTAEDDELRAVVAVPANASSAQRLLTLDAFRRAGFVPVAMLNEPSAAGFEYTHRHRDTLTSKRDQVVVYDLGGGTFDASLVRMRGRRHEVLATGGVSRLGGDDFDALLVELVLDRAGLREGDLDERARARLAEHCRDAKERLNPSSKKLSIDLDAALGDSAPALVRGAPVVVAVADYYAACGPLVERSIEAMTPVMQKLEGEGDELPGEIAGIYVVGGASELPIVARALRARFGRRVHRSPYPSAAIAIGLAIACDDDAGFELSDRYSRTFGVFRERSAGAEITFDPIFTRDTELPGRGEKAIVHRRDYRAAHNLGHFRFLECNDVGDDGRPRGDMTVSGDVLFPFSAELRGVTELGDVPVTRVFAHGPRVEESYSLDENGIVAITIRDLDAGHERVFRLGAS